MNRIVHIDVAKAVGMMLIIASHVGVSAEVRDSSPYHWWNAALNSFYVPLFFVLSGVFESSERSWNRLFGRVAKLGKFTLIFCLFGFLSAGLIQGSWDITACTRTTVVWFLFTLLWMTLLMHVVKYLPWNIWAACAIAVLGTMLSYYGRSCCFVGQAMLCFPFYYVGFYLRDYIKVPKFHWQYASVALAMWLIVLICCYSEQNLSINYVSQNYISMYVGAFSGSFLFIELSKLLGGSLVYYGKNTIVPMMVHLSFVWLLAIYSGARSFYFEADTLLNYYVSAIAVCVLSGCCIPLFRNNKYDLFR